MSLFLVCTEERRSMQYYVNADNQEEATEVAQQLAEGSPFSKDLRKQHDVEDYATTYKTADVEIVSTEPVKVY